MPVGFLFCDMSAGLWYGLFNMNYGLKTAKNTLPPSPEVLSVQGNVREP